MKLIQILGTAAFIVVTATATASEDKPQHGGIVREVRDVSYELVARPEAIAIYATDHGKPVSTTGAMAKVTLLNGAEKTEATLMPAGDNKLEAKGSFKVQAGTKLVAVITLAGKPPVTTRYEIK
jgi:hypothetical protein